MCPLETTRNWTALYFFHMHAGKQGQTEGGRFPYRGKHKKGRVLIRFFGNRDSKSSNFTLDAGGKRKKKIMRTHFLMPMNYRESLFYIIFCRIFSYRALSDKKCHDCHFFPYFSTRSSFSAQKVIDRKVEGLSLSAHQV